MSDRPQDQEKQAKLQEWADAIGCEATPEAIKAAIRSAKFAPDQIADHVAEVRALLTQLSAMTALAGCGVYDVVGEPITASSFNEMVRRARALLGMDPR